jgi:hypothetical protein
MVAQQHNPVLNPINLFSNNSTTCQEQYPPVCASCLPSGICAIAMPSSTGAAARLRDPLPLPLLLPLAAPAVVFRVFVGLLALGIVVGVRISDDDRKDGTARCTAASIDLKSRNELLVSVSRDLKSWWWRMPFSGGASSPVHVLAPDGGGGAQNTWHKQ